MKSSNQIHTIEKILSIAGKKEPQEMVTFVTTVTLLFQDVEYPFLELSLDSDRCMIFSRNRKKYPGGDILFVFLDYRVEQTCPDRLSFSGYMEMEDSEPGSEYYRFVRGEIFIHDDEVNLYGN